MKETVLLVIELIISTLVCFNSDLMLEIRPGTHAVALDSRFIDLSRGVMIVTRTKIRVRQSYNWFLLQNNKTALSFI